MYEIDRENNVYINFNQITLNHPFAIFWYCSEMQFIIEFSDCYYDKTCNICCFYCSPFQYRTMTFTMLKFPFTTVHITYCIQSLQC